VGSLVDADELFCSILPYYALKGTERGVPIPIRDRKAEMEIGEVENVQITYLDIIIDSF